MEIIRKRYRPIIAFLIFFAALFFLIPLGKKERCLWQENFNSRNYFGVVIDQLFCIPK